MSLPHSPHRYSERSVPATESGRARRISGKHVAQPPLKQKFFHFSSVISSPSRRQPNREDILKAALELNTRIEPKQVRAQRRIADILRATETLLASGAKVTTSTIAGQAGIPVGSVYRYFPNVLSIYRTLFEKLNGELRARIFTVAEDANDEKNWEIILEEILAQSIDLYSQHPAYGNLLQMMADPLLQSVRLACVDATSKIFADRWRTGKDGFHSGDIDSVAQTASRLFTFVEQSYFEQKCGENDATLFLEMAKALRAYLSLHLST